MAKKNAEAACCDDSSSAKSGLTMDALVTVDERGQMVLPKELRDRAGIGPGDKLAVVTWERDGKVCCISLIKADAFSDMVSNLLGPMAREMAPQ